MSGQLLQTTLRSFPSKKMVYHAVRTLSQEISRSASRSEISIPPTTPITAPFSPEQITPVAALRTPPNNLRSLYGNHALDSIYCHGTTSLDAKNICDKGVNNHKFYLMEVKLAPLRKEAQSFDDFCEKLFASKSFQETMAYAEIAAEKQYEPVVLMFESPTSSPILCEVTNQPCLFGSCSTPLTIHAVLGKSQEKGYAETVLPEQGKQTRKEGDTFFWFSISWYGKPFAFLLAVSEAAEQLGL